MIRERCRFRLIDVGEIGEAVPGLVRAGRPRSQEVVMYKDMVYTAVNIPVNIPKLQRNRPVILAFRSMAVSLALVFCSIRMMLAPDPPLVIGQRKQLLVDDYVLASTSRLDRQLGEVVKHPHPVLLPDRPWDDPSAFGGYLTVLRNQPADKFQMWYMAGEENGIGYAESEDGIHWTRPQCLFGRQDQHCLQRQGAHECLHRSP